ncbi:MAG: tetratricopeptide repeat protein [Candidatus Roizmanbacteria bacterium]
MARDKKKDHIKVIPQEINEVVITGWNDFVTRIFHWFLQNAGPLTFLIVLGLLLYGFTIGYGASSDDTSVVGIPLYKDIAYSFTRLDFFRQLTYVLSYSISPNTTWNYRIFNILFHLSSTILVFAIIKKISKRKIIAFFSAILFIIHPIMIESVTWITGGVYAQFSFYLYLSFLCYLYRKLDIRIYFISILSAGFATVTSEKALVLPILFTIYEYSLGNLKKNWKDLVPYWSIFFVFITLYVMKLNTRIVDYNTKIYIPKGYDNIFFKIPYAVTAYLERIFIPDGYSFYYERQVQLQEQAIRAISFIIFLALSIYWFFRNRMLFFFSMFFLFSLSPFLSPLRISATVAERYVYVGSLGIYTIVAYYFAMFFDKKKYKEGAILIFIMIVVVLSCRTVMRNRDWKTEDDLWLSALQTAPDSSFALNNAGNVYAKRRDFKTAEQMFLRSAKINPGNASAIFNLGIIYQEAKLVEPALNAYKQALKIDPTVARAYVNIGVLLNSTEKYSEAIQNFETALKLSSNEVNAYAGMADSYRALKEYDKSIIYYQKSLSYNPNSWLPYYFMAEIYAIKKNPKLAEENYLNALQREQKVVQIYTSLARLYANTGNYEKALNVLLKAQILDPNNQAVKTGISSLQQELKK